MKRYVIFLIIILIVISCLFPPWRRIYKIEDSNIKKFKAVGYSFILDRPPYDADTIDFGRLGVQLGLLVFLGCCVRFSGYIFPRKQPMNPRRGLFSFTLVSSIALGFIAPTIIIVFFIASEGWDEDMAKLWIVGLFFFAGIWILYSIIRWVIIPISRWVAKSFRNV